MQYSHNYGRFESKRTHSGDQLHYYRYNHSSNQSLLLELPDCELEILIADHGFSAYHRHNNRVTLWLWRNPRLKTTSLGLSLWEYMDYDSITLNQSGRLGYSSEGKTMLGLVSIYTANTRKGIYELRCTCMVISPAIPPAGVNFEVPCENTDTALSLIAKMVSGAISAAATLNVTLTPSDIIVPVACVVDHLHPV